MPNKLLLSSVIACCLAIGPSGFAWTTVGPGIEYQEFSLPDPNRLFVARMDRDNLSTMVDTTLGGGRLGVSETIGSQASRYDDAINYYSQDWGQRNDVIVAVNGDFLDTSNNTPLLGQVMTGWYMKTITSSRRFFFRLDHDLAIGYGGASSRYVNFVENGHNISIDEINTTRDAGTLILYTAQYGSTTGTDSTGVEVDVEMTRPNIIGVDAVGYIRQVRQNAGSTPIPFDHIILSGTGSVATSLVNYAQVGQRVRIIANLAGYPIDFIKTYASLGGGETFLGDGYVWGGQDIKNPRTAIALNDRYLFFVVCDGRSTISVGMTMTELGNFCKDYLGATWGINQDGGGSSTMIVNGTLKNKPSDGSQRSVVNGLFMGNSVAKQQSTTFSTGDIVKTSGAGNSLRLGPGTNYLQLTTIGNNQQATIVDHSLRGVYAKGLYWWKCNFSGTEGWMSQSLLTLVTANSTLPRFTQHPTIQSTCPGGNVSFTAAASNGTISYQWYYQGQAISENASYSGTSTATLNVTSVSESLAGSYYCVATNAAGSTTSYSAALHAKLNTAILTQPQPTAEPRVPLRENVTFTIRARGEGTLAYRWQKNGVNLSDSTKYSGTTSTTFTINNVDTYDEGSYQCVITSECAPVTSNANTLVVLSTDFDRDLDVDQDDFAHLQACLSGPTVLQADPACADANLENDAEGDVSLNDIALWIPCFTGPNVPRLGGC